VSCVYIMHSVIIQIGNWKVTRKNNEHMQEAHTILKLNLKILAFQTLQHIMIIAHKGVRASVKTNKLRYSRIISEFFAINAFTTSHRLLLHNLGSID
jgi:hypothetical protein